MPRPERCRNRPARCLQAAICSAVAAIVFASCFFAAAGATAADAAVVAQWDSLFGVAFSAPENAFAVGSKGTLLESRNAGKTWKRRQLGSPVEPYDLYSVRFANDGSTGWIVGEGGSIFRTKDGGTSWVKLESPVKDSLFKVAVLNADTACAVGANGVLLCTENGGSSWELNHFIDFTFFDVAFSPKGGAWAVGDYRTVVASSDNGKHWQLQAGGKRVFTEPPNFAVAFNPSGDGVIAALGPAIQQTRDNGQSWQPVPLTETKQVYAVVANQGAGATEFWIAGGEGLLLDIGDGKSSKVATGVAADISDIGFSGDVGVAVGLGGTLFRLQHVDNRWRVSANPTRANSVKQVAQGQGGEFGYRTKID